MKTTFTIAIALLTSLATGAQGKPADTVMVELAKTSKVVFTMRERSDLEILKRYDFQALFNDILIKLEKKDTVRIEMLDTPVSEIPTSPVVNAETWGEEDEDDEWNDSKERKYRNRKTHNSFNFDLGTNNFLEDGNFPDANGAQHAVRPWGSWYVGFNSIQRTPITNNFFIEWGVGISWYNFKFQQDNTVITQDDTGITFSEDTRDVNFIKSKLTVTYINASFIPMLDFGGNNRKARIWNSNNSAFRIGAGPYVGYRIGSHTKLVYKEDGDKEKDKDRDNFYLNNLRYGVRLQIGVRSTDFFFNYDMNELFAPTRGPKLNAFSFGVIF